MRWYGMREPFLAFGVLAGMQAETKDASSQIALAMQAFRDAASAGEARSKKLREQAEEQRAYALEVLDRLEDRL